jgi:hypothetical protein
MGIICDDMRRLDAMSKEADRMMNDGQYWMRQAEAIYNTSVRKAAAAAPATESAAAKS